MNSREHVIKGSYGVMGRSSLFISPPCQICWPYALWCWRYDGFILSCDPARPYDLRVVILREIFPQAKSPSGAKFRSHKPCGRGNIVVLVCHLISQDHTMKKSAPRHYRRCGGSVPTQEKIMWLYGWELLMVSHHPAKFGSKIPHACSNRHSNAHGMQAHSILC